MLTLNSMQFIMADGSTGADTITAGAINQTLTGGAGADTLIGFSGGFDTFKDTAANLNGDTIKSFVTSDTIDLTNLAYAATNKVTTAASGTNTKVTVTAGTTKSTFTLAGSWPSSGFHLCIRRCNGLVLDAYLSKVMTGCMASSWTSRGRASRRTTPSRSPNGRFREECLLNAYWFLSLDDARLKCEAWRRDCNEVRSCSGGLRSRHASRCRGKSC